MLSLSPAVKLWYCPDPVDMRLGFDGLFNLVKSRLQADPLSGHLFIFRNKNAARLEVLSWGGSSTSGFFNDRAGGGGGEAEGTARPRLASEERPVTLSEPFNAESNARVLNNR